MSVCVLLLWCVLFLFSVVRGDMALLSCLSHALAFWGIGEWALAKFFAKLVIYRDIDVVCDRLNAFQSAIIIKIGLVTNIKHHFVAPSPQNCLTLHEIYIYEV